MHLLDVNLLIALCDEDHVHREIANQLLNRTGAFWQSESYEHLIRDERDFERIVAYIVQNPKKSRLETWKWVWSDKDLCPCGMSVPAHGEVPTKLFYDLS